MDTLSGKSGWSALGVGVSRIWDALKAAEQHRARAIERKNVVQLQTHRGDRRHSRRAEANIPVFVYGSNSYRQPFHEEAFTLDFNDGGCLLSVAADVVAGQRLYLTNTENQAERECRVIHVSKRMRGRVHIGVGFRRPDPEFWQAN